ncbi:MAG TPA: PfkB family carbohydrate kinase [Pseudonocardiaceae bacterium]|nr:PfkB family carbohydrate kinase [Pseudonocardiaceae bacterium]
MIVCVAPSPAIDVTYRVASLRVGGANRVSDVIHRPGGKAVNVARVLTTLGQQAVVLAPVGGESGDRFRAGLAERGVAAELVDVGAPTRRTVTVLDDATGEATLLSEPATVADWTAVAERFTALLPSADVVVVSGSLPIGAPQDAIADLVRQARRAGRPIVVDSSGAALARAIAAGPTVAKPNAAELAELTGNPNPLAAVGTAVGTVVGPVVGAAPVAGAAGAAAAGGAVGAAAAGGAVGAVGAAAAVGGLAAAAAGGLAGAAAAGGLVGATAIVASLGADGLIAAGPGGCWRGRPGTALRGNPTGAGDALVAGLAIGLKRGQRLVDMLADAMALAAAAVLQPCAGDIDPADVTAQRAGVRIEAIR